MSDILNVYGIYDTKLEMYVTPLYETNDNTAIRTLQSILKQGKTAICENPSDYTLVHLATQDQKTGLYESVTPKLVINCDSLVQV